MIERVISDSAFFQPLTLGRESWRISPGSSLEGQVMYSEAGLTQNG